MMNIGPINSVNAAQSIKPTSAGRATSAAQSTSSTTQPADTVEISLQAKVASTLANVPPIRADLVARVKSEIQAGTYETPEKLDAALDGLMKEL